MVQRLDAKKILGQNSIWLVLIALCAFMAVYSPHFLTPVNITNLLTTEAIKGIVTVGVMFCILSKGIDLSTGSVVALSSVVSASLVQEIHAHNKIIEGMYPLSPYVALLAGLTVGLLVGLFNGALIAYTKIPAFIATLGTMLIARALAQLYTLAQPVAVLTPEFTVLGRGMNFGLDAPNFLPNIPNVVLIFLIVLGIGAFMLNRTRYGKNVYAIGGNDMAARVAGINVEFTLVKVYAFSGLCAGLAGVLLAARTVTGHSVHGTGLELDAIAAATVGGVSHSGGIGRISSVFAGILVLGVVSNGLLILGVSPYLQNVVRGGIIIGAVAFDMRKHAKRA